MGSKALHNFRGNGPWCGYCDLPESLHAPKRERKEYFARRDRNRVRAKSVDRIIGIDGEGQGRYPHLYTYLAAQDEDGRKWSVENDSGLTTDQCFRFLIGMPNRALCFGYAFVYDLTKICQGLPDLALYLLFHEEKRARIVEGRVIYRPITWEGWRINYMNRRFTLERDKRRVTVWDIFRFFATKFTGALLDWKIADKQHLERMELMKSRRSEFDKLSKGEIHAYCQEECAYLSRLGRRLLTAHNDAGLPLKHFYGAGSTASAFLTKIDVNSKRGDIPEAMRIAVACAFFGGRFENSWVGPITGTVYDYDISSAYPYNATLLPCLLHGTWSHTRNGARLDNARLALVRWTLVTKANAAWGPLPIRSKDGTICFPLSAKGGWTWKNEFLAARRLNPNVEFLEAWTYETNCDCAPFKDIPTYYRERIRLGKDAEGLVIKLGLNSIYGKLAQSRGLNPPYQSWVWAGNITSGCRAQLLDALSRSASVSGWDTLMLATDGVWTRRPLTLPKPHPTGTQDLPKPLGGWDEKKFERGVFCVRPGIYFPLQPTEDEIEKVRARGLGRRLLYEQWQKILDAWEARQSSVTLSGVSRFIGAKTGFSYGKKSGLKRSPNYGEWVEHPVEVSFSPLPKRAAILSDNRLAPIEHVDYQSVPYDRATLSAEAMLLRIAEQIAEEQPNADFSEIR